MTEHEEESGALPAAALIPAALIPTALFATGPSGAALRADAPARCSGALADLAVADVLQLLQLIGKSAVMTVTVEHGGAQSRLWCSEGSLIDAESGRLRGEAAAYRILALDDGWLEAELRHELRPRTIEAPTQRLLLEAARRKDETLALQRKLGEQRCCYRLVHEPEPEQLASQTAAELHLLRVLASAPSLGELLAESELGDLETLMVLDRWFDAGYLAKVGLRPEAPASHSAIDAALFSSPQHLPSVPPLTASVAPRRAPRSPRFAAAAAAAALLALASFAGGYLLRGPSGTPVSTAAGPFNPGEVLEAPRPDAELTTAEARNRARADHTAPADPSNDDAPGAAAAATSPSAASDSAAQDSPNGLEPTAEGGTSASVPASGAAPIAGQQLAFQEPAASSGRAVARSVTSAAANGPPSPARVGRTPAATPAISEPRVRVIGATEPSVRLLE